MRDIQFKPTNHLPAFPGRAMLPSSPFDPLLPLLAAAQRTGPTVWGSIAQLEVIFTTGMKMPLLMAGGAPAIVPPVGDPGDFDPTPLQAKILRFLVDGAKSPKQLRDKTTGRMYEPRGIGELIELGIVEKKYGKFRLTPDVGEQIVAELGDDEDEE